MRSLLITTAMLAAIGTAAMAQNTSDQPNPNGAAPPAAEQSGAPGQPSTSSTPGAMNNGAMNNGAVNPPAAAAPPAAANANGMGADTSAQTPAPQASNNQPTDTQTAEIGQAPDSYPVCKSHKQDRCRVPHSWR